MESGLMRITISKRALALTVWDVLLRCFPLRFCTWTNLQGKMSILQEKLHEISLEMSITRNIQELENFTVSLPGGNLEDLLFDFGSW